MEIATNKVSAYEVSFPNEVSCEEEPESPKLKGVAIVEGNDQFRFHGTTGFIEEEKSVFQKAGYLKLQESIPVVPKRAAFVCLIFNCLCPGLGTALGAFAGIIWPCDQYMAGRWIEVFVWNITASIFQLFTTVYFLIGYFWGIWWGILMVQKAPPAIQERTFNIRFGRKQRESYVEKAQNKTTAQTVVPIHCQLHG